MLTQVQLRLASIALEDGDAAQARRLFQLARDAPDAPTQQAAVSGLGDVQLFLGDVPGARQAYQEVMRRLPESSMARYATYQLGRIAMQTGAFADAAATFQQLAASAEPDLADNARFALVLTYLSQQEHDLRVPLWRSCAAGSPARPRRPGPPTIWHSSPPMPETTAPPRSCAMRPSRRPR